MAPLTLVHRTTPTTTDSRQDPRQMLMSNLDTVRAIVAAIARAQRLTTDERDELSSYVMLRLLEDDGAILRKFEQRSALKTYLTVVIKRLALDFRDQAWGKWRPSASARRHGRIGVLLESLTAKRGLSFDEACQVLRANHGLEFKTTELAGIHRSFPIRQPRRFLAEEALESVAAHGASPERGVCAAQSASRGEQICAMLAASLEEMSAEERTLLLLRYRRGLSVATIARQLSIDPKALYRRYEGLLANLRRRLQEKGMAVSDLIDVLAQTQVELRPVLGRTASIPERASGDRRILGNGPWVA